MDLAYTLKKAFAQALNLKNYDGIDFEGESKLASVQSLAQSLGLNMADILSFAAIHEYKRYNGVHDRNKRNSLSFLKNTSRSLDGLQFAPKMYLDVELIHAAVLQANNKIELIHDLSVSNNVEIFELLGLRNLSAFVGEIFSNELYHLGGGLFKKNPNQDGYPDLLAMTPEGDAYYRERVKNNQISDKTFWSPFPFGGIEVKATCGNTPNAKIIKKPKIGDSRYEILVSAEWKAHHRETNNLVGIFWDFINGLPTVLAVFFRNDLDENDWGKIVQPKDGGGRTTSVSIMVKGSLQDRIGVKKMGEGWLVLPTDPMILRSISKKQVFSIPTHSIEQARK